MSLNSTLHLIPSRMRRKAFLDARRRIAAYYGATWKENGGCNHTNREHREMQWIARTIRQVGSAFSSEMPRPKRVELILTMFRQFIDHPLLLIHHPRIRQIVYEKIDEFESSLHKQALLLQSTMQQLQTIQQEIEQGCIPIQLTWESVPHQETDLQNAITTLRQMKEKFPSHPHYQSQPSPFLCNITLLT